MPTKYVSGDRNEILVPVESATDIQAGDLIAMPAGYAVPFSLLGDSGTELQNQTTAHGLFLGVARDSSQPGQTDRIRVATTGTFEFDCVSATYAIGNFIGPNGTGSGELVGVSNTQVVGVASAAAAVGKVAQSFMPGSANPTRLRVAITSVLVYGGPQVAA